MKKIIFKFATLLALVSSHTYSATSLVSGLEGVSFQLISSGTSRLYIYGIDINAGCTNKTPVIIFEGNEANDLAKEFYSTLLMAKASGRKVQLEAGECWTEWSTPKVRSMYLIDN